MALRTSGGPRPGEDDASRARLDRRRVLLGAAGGSLVSLLKLKAQTGSSPSVVDGLRNSLRGRLVVPADSEYDSIRKTASFNPTTDKHPKMIVQCATAED